MSNTDTITVPAAPAQQAAPVAPAPATTEFIGGGVQPPAYVAQQAANQAAAHAAATAPAPRMFSEAELEAARTQEKDKVYGRLEEVTTKYSTLEQRLAEIEAEKQAREKEAQDALEAQRLAEEQAELAQMTAKDQIAALRAENEARFAALDEERKRAEALLTQEQEFQRIQGYRQQRLSDPAIAQAVMPHLHPYIQGTSEQEIEDSIARYAQTSQQILADVAAMQQNRFQQAPGVSTSAPTIGPSEVQDTTRQLSAADIQNMSLADYARLRPQVGMR